MKKIVAVIVLFFAFTVNSFAQDKKVVGLDREQMLIDTNEMVTYLDIDDNLKHSLLMLVDMRIESVSTTSTPSEAKKMNEVFNNKILAGLSPEKRDKLIANRALYKKIIIE